MCVKSKHARDLAIEFFQANAGYSYDPETQTVEQGQRQCAESLADAEQWAHDNDMVFTWEEDPEPYAMGDAETEMPKEVLCCGLADANGDCLASLCQIGDPTSAHMRVVEAELASEARANNEPQRRIDRIAQLIRAAGDCVSQALILTKAVADNETRLYASESSATYLTAFASHLVEALQAKHAGTTKDVGRLEKKVRRALGFTIP